MSSIGSVSVDIVPNVRNFARQVSAQIMPEVDALAREITEKLKFAVQVDTAHALEQLDVIAAKSDEIASKSASIRVGVDDAHAIEQLDAVKIKADEVGLKHPTVKVDADTKGAESKLAGLGSGISNLVLGGAALAPALIPVAAVLAGALGAISVPLAAATAGVGAFTILAVPAFKQVTTASTALAKAQLAVTNAVTNKQRQTALLKEQQLLAQLSPVQRAAVVSLNALKTSFKNLQTALAPQLFGVFNAGLRAANALLPSLAPLVRAVSPALVGLGNSLTGAFKSDAFKQFVAFLAAQAGPAVTAFGKVLGNLAKGFAGLLQGFGGFAPALEGGLVSLSAKFADVGKSQGFRNFIDYVRANGPKVGAAFLAIGGAAAHIVAALAPLGGPVLAAITGIANAVRAIPAPALAALAIGFVGVAAGLKAVGLAAGPVGTVLKAIIGVVGGPELLLAIGVIAALAAAFVLLYRNSAPVRSVIAEVGRTLKSVFEAALPVLKKVGGEAMQGIRAGIGYISAAIISNRPAIDQFIAAFKAIALLIVTKILPLLGPVLRGAFTLLGASIGGAITIVSHLWTAFRTMATISLGATRVLLQGLLALVNVGAALPGKLSAPFKAMQGPINAAIGVVNGLDRALDSAARPRTITVHVNLSGTAAALRAAGFSSQGAQNNARALSYQARASGGPVSAGQPYIVGEHRPEVFVPTQPGYVVPSVSQYATQVASTPATAAIGTPPASGSSLAGADLARLADALDSRPVQVILDSRVLARSVQTRMLRDTR